MDRQSKINEFIIAVEGLSNSVNDITFKASELFLDGLENSILQYIRDNYPAIIITKDELKSEIESVYQEKHLNLKKTIDKNIGLMKYNIEDPSGNVDIDKIIKEEIEKYKKMFMSVQAGTNISYLGLVDKCTENVMRLLIRKNNSISFAKHTGDVRNYISKLVSDCYLSVMMAVSDKLLDDGIIPIEEDFKVDNGKSKIKAEDF